MLVLSRKLYEKVTIYHPGLNQLIEIQIVGIDDKGKIRLGFTAEPEAVIVRNELIEYGPDHGDGNNHITYQRKTTDG